MSNECLPTGPICLFGAGGHGRVLSANLRRSGRTSISFADEGLAVGTEVDGIPVLFSRIADIAGHSVIVAIGDNKIRKERQQAAEAAGLTREHFIAEPIRYLAPPPGPGAMVLLGAVVEPAVKIGAGAIVNNNSVLEHDVIIGDFAHVCPGVVIGGNARIGEGVLLGSNATVLPGVSIAAWTIVGAGAVVVRDITEPGVYAGIPAKKR